MKRTILFLIAATLLTLPASRSALRGQRDVLRMEKEKDDLYVIYGNGGNTVVYATPTGALVVDSKFEDDGPGIISQIKSVTDKPIKYLVNTHHHPDHTHGNPAFAPNTEIVAQTGTKRNLVLFDTNFWRGPREQALPSHLVEAHEDLFEGDWKVELVYYGRGHTNSDLVVVFPKVRAAHLGDLFTFRSFPSIDTAAGGSAKQLLITLEKVVARNDIDTFIPGHGEVTTREKFLEYVQMLRDMQVATAQAIKDKKNLDDFLNNLKLEKYATWRGYPERMRQNATIMYNELMASDSK